MIVGASNLATSPASQDPATPAETASPTPAETSQTPAEELARLSGYGPTSPVAQAQYRLDLVAHWPLRAGARVLELGCGQGDTTLALAAAVGPAGHVDAVDPGPLDYGAPTTLGQAHAVVSAGPLGARIAWVQADPLAFLAAHPEDRWDAAVLAHSLWYFASPALIRATLAALAPRVTHVCVAEWSLEGGAGAAPHVLAVLAQGALEGRKPAAESEANVRTVVGPARIKALAGEAGLELRREARVVPGKGVHDGQWEVLHAVREEFGAEVERFVRDERERAGVYAIQDAVKASVERVGGVRNVETMDGWVAVFEAKT
ncbi:SAM-dependent methyltransferase-like protein [Mycena belliarum]|uniref:SAM-dependent methyltransferase-like protein n=1 Tax=Mycena belliarum TaxID=1033014 RepID=A0AAD6UCA8_9AGAR|nr:SAM-dependent methyltransferase-like protein [Mycena belliae]